MASVNADLDTKMIHAITSALTKIKAMKAPFLPILSQLPFARTASLSVSISWYLSEELPALITRIFITIVPFGSCFQFKI